MFSFEGKRYSIGTTELSYNVQQFKTGLYFVKVSGENGTSVKKWVKR
jgi:hypothetical protein